MLQTVASRGGERLDKYLVSAGMGLSRSEIQKLIEEGKVLVDGKEAKSHHRIRKGERIEINFEKHPRTSITEPEDIPLDIVYEDDDLIVVNKVSGMVVHPAKGNLNGTMVNALLYHCKTLPTVSEETRPGVVHRLDKETTGLLVFGKSDYTLRGLIMQMEKRKMSRKYKTITWGKIPQKTGVIEAPIGRHFMDRKRMTVTPLHSRSALTHYSVLERFSTATYLELRLETGRTHQVRVHLAHLGHPVLGDPTYGGRKTGMIKSLIQQDEGISKKKGRTSLEEVIDQALGLIKRQALHAETLGFFHPKKKEWMEFQAPLPEDMENVLDYLRGV
jgi:23S rRNA pseudouridine1911/1915/1917 synthase